MITGFFAAIFALFQIVLTRKIIRIRMRERVSLGDGGLDDLQTATRIHGNFVETVPMALILMGMAELSGAPFWTIYALGLMMVVSRISHACALSTPPGHGRYRVLGMALTFVVYMSGSAICLWRFFTASL